MNGTAGARMGSEIQLVELGGTQVANALCRFAGLQGCQRGVGLRQQVCQRGARRNGIEVAKHLPNRQAGVAFLKTVGGIAREPRAQCRIGLLDFARLAQARKKMPEVNGFLHEMWAEQCRLVYFHVRQIIRYGAKDRFNEHIKSVLTYGQSVID
jgi:hypothetical protein